MKKNLSILTVLFLLAVFPALGNTSVAQDSLPVNTGYSADSLSARSQLLYFRFDRSLVDSGYRSNRETLAKLRDLFTDSRMIARIDSVCIRAYASPDGNAAYNRRLALKRARAVKGYLIWKYPGLNQYRIHTSYHVEDWDILHAAIESDTRIPYREEVLQILARDISSARKEVLLKELHDGSAYRYIFRRILPELRNASICTVYVRPMKHPDSASPVSLSLSGSERGWGSSLSAESDYPDFQSNGHEKDRYDQYLTEMRRLHPRRVPLLALKTNLLFDAALMPNIEVEVPIGKRWSVNGEYMFPWWLMDGDKYSMQILMGGLEGRYWLGSRENRLNREVLTGHFLGLYAGGGMYDLQWKENGYQGEFFIAAGLSYGWATRIARNLHLELNIGIGMLRTNYRHYHARDNYQTLLWQENGNYTWFGPTKAKVSLVWLLNRKAKEGGMK